MSEYTNLDDYTLDLGKLEESSNLPIVNRKREVEQIDSEDDGPEDFTLNLEKWMRGTGPYKQGEGPPKDKETVHIDAEDESEFLPQDSSTPTPQRSQKFPSQGPAATSIRPRKPTVEDAAEVDSPLRLPTPKLPRLNTEMEQERAAEEVFDRISALQAEVERLRDENENRFATSKRLEEEKAQLQAENQKLQTRLKNTDSKVLERRAEIEERIGASKVLEEKNTQLHADNQKLYTRLQDTNALVLELRTENEEHAVARRNLEESNGQMRQECREIHNQLQEANAVVKDFRSKAEKQADSSRKLEEENAKMQSDNQKLFTRLQETEAETQDLRIENEELSTANKGLQEDIAQLEADKQGIECHR